jgi:Protein of unknown function (DUF2800)
MSQHAQFAPSAAHRWVPCPGSVAMNKDKKDETSPYAEEGTRAHEVAAARLKDIPGPAADDQEASDYINVYVSDVRQAAEGKMLLLEKRVDLERHTGEKGGKGTADAIIVDAATKTIEVRDLKFGKGVIVYAENNEQLMLYALGAIDLVEDLLGVQIETAKLVIHQPRRDHISEATVTRAELEDFSVKTRGAAELARASMKALEKVIDKDTYVVENLNPTDHGCRWCPAKGECSALAARVHKEVFDSFATMDDGNVLAVTKPIGTTLPTPAIVGMIEAWLEGAQDAIREKLQAGTAVPGWKLVDGRDGNRKFTDELKAAELCKELRFKQADTHVHKLKSVAQLEKVIGKKKWPKFAELVDRAPGKPTVAPESDKRPAVTAAAKVGDFDIFKDDHSDLL